MMKRMLTYQTKAAAVNAICPYFTMYPLSFPLAVLQRHGATDQWVLDPFCGRGTTNLSARLVGMGSVGIDSSEVAVAIAKAKLHYVPPFRVLRAAREILASKVEPASTPEGPFWHWAFHKTTLRQICLLREALLLDCRSEARTMLRAIVLGALHGPLSKADPSYLSNQCVRTFAPKPAYAVQYWERKGLRPREVATFDVISRRVSRFLSCQAGDGRGHVVLADSRLLDQLPLEQKFDWVVTSPPYYGMRTYIPDQWLRHWFLGGPDWVEYVQRPSQLSHSSPDEFAQQIGRVWMAAALTCKTGARLVCRFGGIHDRKADPLKIAKQSFSGTPWRLTHVRQAGNAASGKRQALQFRQDQRFPREEFDLYARLC